MPYRLEQSGTGYYVVGPSGRHSGRPMPRSRAVRQMRALYAAESKNGPDEFFNKEDLAKSAKRARPITEEEIRGFRQKVADLMAQGMSESDAAETVLRFANRHMMMGVVKDAGTEAGTPLHGPGGLLGVPGLGTKRGRKWGNRRKHKSCTCGVNVATKEQLSPGVTRIRGNLCNVHGRYGPCDASASAAKKPKGKKGRKGRKPANPKLTPEQRLAERQAKQTENRAKVLSGLGIGADGQKALEALRAGQQPDASAILSGGFEQAGLVERAADGSYRLTASGRAALSAASQGDQGRAGDIISGARDRVGARVSRQQATEQRRTEAAAKRAAAEAERQKRQAEAAKKRGASGGKKQSTAGDREAERQAMRRQREQEHQSDRARRLREHEEDRARRAEGRIVRDAERNQSRASRDAEKPAQRATRVESRRPGVQGPSRKRGKLQRSNVGIRTKSEIYGGVKRSNLDEDVFAGPDRSFPIKTAQDVRDAVRSLGRTKHDKEAVKRGIIRRAQSIGATDALPESWREKSFTVFKSDDGSYRWVARTTTAYRDRDGEIITTKALENDAARMTATGQYGPLRYWHLGTPDPFDVIAPWGAGVDIGDCDYSTVIGRTSIESGTFKSHAIGKAFADSADEYELSPGFFHPINEPNERGEYGEIRRFERSVVPTAYGRASNLFTGMAVKDYAEYKAQSAEDRAMFAKMGGGGGGGGKGGGGGSKLWPVNPTTGKREPPRGVAGGVSSINAVQGNALPVKPRSVDATDALLKSGNTVKRLTKDQEIALRYYQSQGHETVNSVLRGTTTDPIKQDRTDRTTAQLDRVMRRATLKDNVEAHRGMIIEDAAGHAMLARMQPGATLREPGYISTSIDPAVIRRFGGNTEGDVYPGVASVSMRVRVSAGTRAIYMPAARPLSGAHVEKELFIDRGAVYRVISRRERNGHVEIEIEVLGNE